MIFFKKLLKYCLYLFSSIILYLLISILLSYITVNKTNNIDVVSKTIYLHSNGVHLSVILPVDLLSEPLKKNFELKNSRFVKFGWGDKNFYLNTPTWSEFKIKYAFGAFFLDNPTVIHIQTLKNAKKNWVVIKVNSEQLDKLNTYLQGSFQMNLEGNKLKVAQDIYGERNFFYEAKGSYSPIKTCNTWVNNAFKESGLKASYWTLFDFGLLHKYKK